MRFRYDDEGNWQFDGEPAPSTNAEYRRVLPGYLSAFDKLFIAAKKRSEFDFVLALVHHTVDFHRDPYETTKRTFSNISALHKQAPNFETEITLALWLYGHIVEAAYPYQLVADLLGIAAGKPHGLFRFPRTEDGDELSPGRKITELEKMARETGLKPSVKPLRYAWNALLRNAIFHSNYAIFGDQIHLTVPGRTLKLSSVMNRINRAVAAFEALVSIEEHHRRAYTKSVDISAPEYFAHEPGTTVTVVVREGYGPVAIHSTVVDFGDQISPVILGRMTAKELELVKNGTFLLPPLSNENQE